MREKASLPCRRNEYRTVFVFARSPVLYEQTCTIVESGAARFAPGAKKITFKRPQAHTIYWEVRVTDQSTLLSHFYRACCRTQHGHNRFGPPAVHSAIMNARRRASTVDRYRRKQLVPFRSTFRKAPIEPVICFLPALTMTLFASSTSQPPLVKQLA